MNECGPEWHMLQFQMTRVVSDLMTLKLCWQFAGAAIAEGVGELVGWWVGGLVGWSIGEGGSVN